MAGENIVQRRRWARFVHLHYVVNAALVLNYGIVRWYMSAPRLTSQATWTGFSQETEIIGLATATLVSKYRKMATFDEFLARFFVIGKAAVAVLLFFVGIPHMVWYLILWTACSLVVPYPRFVLPSEVSTLNPGEFQSMVRSSSAQAPGERVAWLVMFHADWCSSSHNLQPMFGALARRYADKNRRFAVVDIVAHPETAEDLNINTAGTSKQLPTLALFASGREVCRLPTFASDGSVVRARMDERGVINYFELDQEFRTTSYSRRGLRGKR
ncbi:unnamed protein product [Ectocarpus sp. 6 AP-2014]